MFARGEGIVPAPETNHAVRAAIDEALKCKQEGKARTILFNLTGHGNFDMQAYADYFAGKLEDRDLDQAVLDTAFAGTATRGGLAEVSSAVRAVASKWSQPFTKRFGLRSSRFGLMAGYEGFDTLDLKEAKALFDELHA